MEERMRGLVALSAIAEAISGSLDLDETLDKALVRVMKSLGVEIGAIYLLAEDKGQGRLAAHRGLSEEFVQWANTTQLDQRTIKGLTKAAKERRPLLIIEEVFKLKELLKDIKAAIAREKAHSYLPILLRFGEDLLGVMVVASRQSREFTPEEIDFSVAIGRQIGVAIENTRLYQEQRRQLEERKQAEEALRESEEKYRNIVETAPDGIVTVNLKGIVTSSNSAFANITGFSKSEIVGKHFSKLPTLRARDIAKYIEMFNSIIRGKVPRPFEARWRHKDPTAHWTEVHASLMNKDRKITGFQGILRDITERKGAEEALRLDSEYG